MLQNAGCQAAEFGRNFFHGQRRAYAPFASHADSKESAQGQERPVAGRECGCDFDQRVEDEVDHERQAPAIAVGEQAEKKCADRAKYQRESDGKSHLGVRFVELLADGREAVDDQEVIEGVECPAEKTGENSRVLIGRSGLRGVRHSHDCIVTTAQGVLDQVQPPRSMPMRFRASRCRNEPE